MTVKNKIELKERLNIGKFNLMLIALIFSVFIVFTIELFVFKENPTKDNVIMISTANLITIIIVGISMYQLSKEKYGIIKQGEKNEPLTNR